MAESLFISTIALVNVSVIAEILNMVLSIALGIELRKNMIWTVCWVYLTIESWKVSYLIPCIY